jgi:hypothetical protein
MLQRMVALSEYAPADGCVRCVPPAAGAGGDRRSHCFLDAPAVLNIKNSQLQIYYIFKL